MCADSRNSTVVCTIWSESNTTPPSEPTSPPHTTHSWRKRIDYWHTHTLKTDCLCFGLGLPTVRFVYVAACCLRVPNEPKQSVTKHIDPPLTPDPLGPNGTRPCFSGRRRRRQQQQHVCHSATGAPQAVAGGPGGHRSLPGARVDRPGRHALQDPVETRNETHAAA